MRAFEQRPKQARQSEAAKLAKRAGARSGRRQEVRSLLSLQRTIGNQGIQSFLRSDADGLEVGSAGRTAYGLARELRRSNVHSSENSNIQRKLTVGAATGKYEREADQVAERILRMSVPQEDSRTSAAHPAEVQRECAQCDDELQRQGVEEVEPIATEEAEELAQGKEATSQRPVLSPDIRSRTGHLRGGGHPLSGSARDFFEPRFGHDFGQVRIHSDDKAAETARSIHARAFTIGTDIVFGAGEYAPGTQVGKKLIAHELTHVLQQNKYLNRKEKGVTVRSRSPAPMIMTATTDAARRRARCIAMGCPARLFRPAHGGMCGVVRCGRASNYRGIPFSSPGWCTFRCPDEAYCGGVLVNVPFFGYRFVTIRCFRAIEGGRAEAQIEQSALARNRVPQGESQPGGEATA